MNNKKGFTLVELIAVIVLLSIVITLASLSVVSIQGTVKEKQKDRLVEAIKVSAEKYVEDTGLKKVYIDTLIKEGYITADKTNESGEKVILNPVDNASLNCYYYDFTDKNNNFKSGNCSPDLVSDAVLNIRYCIGNSCNPNKVVPSTWINNSNVYLGVVSSYIDILDDSSTTYTWISPLAPDVLYSGRNYKVVLPVSNYVDEVYELSARNNGKTYTAQARVKIDTALPKVISVSINNAEGYAREKFITSSLTDIGSGLAAYMINTSNTAPSASASGWNTISGNPKEYTISNYRVIENGTYYVWVKDAAGNVNTPGGNSIIVKNIDRIAPTCITSGDSTSWTKDVRTISYGCRDEVGGSGCNVSYAGGSITFNTTIKTGTTPSYVIRDNAGNETTCPVKTVNVYIDKTAPSCTNSGDSTSWTKDNRTITYGCKDDHSGCNASFSGSSKTFNTTTKTASIDAYTIKDNVGNETKCPARTANVYVDKTAPTCTNSGDSTTWTKNNRTITYGCSDSNSGCNASYKGGSKTYSTSITTVTIPSYIIKDNAGNETTCPARTANVYIDKTAPSCTSSGDSTTWTKNNRTITYGCSDSHSGCNSSNKGGSKTFNTTTKTASIDAYTIKDNVGNETKCSARTANVYVDKTAPTCTSSGASAAWTKDNRTITYGCSDSHSGCNSSYSGGSKTYNTTTKTATIDAYTIKDNVGNETKCPAKTVNVYIDKIAPSCTNSGDSTSWTKDDRKITYGCNDADSGCNSSYSGGSKTFNTTTKTATIAEYTIKDNVGNETKCSAKTVNVYVDKTPPSCVKSGDSTSWTKDNRTITYGCSDSHSGCNASFSGGSILFTSTVKRASISEYIIKDNAGNEVVCPAKTVNVFVDKDAPSCKYMGTSKDWTKDNRTIVYGCSDADSSCDVSYSGGSIVFSSTVKKTMISEYTIKDIAGNETICPAKTVNVYVDKTAPTCTNGGDSTDWTKGDRIISYGCNDSDSGCNPNYLGGTETFTTTTKTSKISSYKIKDNVGNTVTCPARTANIYVDKELPSCNIQKSGSSSNGVTVKVTCTDRDSGCNAQSKYEEILTSSKTYTIKDIAGNKVSCDVQVAEQIQKRTASCSEGKTCKEAGCKEYNACRDATCPDECVPGTERDCYTGSPSTCVAADVEKSGFKYCPSTGTSGQPICKSSNQGTTINGYTLCGTCTYTVHKNCAYKTENTCQSGCTKQKAMCEAENCGCKTYKASRSKCGCASWGGWGSWTNAESCSAGETSNHHTKTECRIMYS